ncbi:hypothetical protein RF11_06491 [Thelohanellus kitauei]|uniref:Uncharacterized protein n=1 Tax=Thelohanellus kitauei TaxID=669202 RepID=A0A0C2J944_THEKT|nr:hypothetical protein RF11_06491 [Thelohanellus kitauei]
MLQVVQALLQGCFRTISLPPHNTGKAGKTSGSEIKMKTYRALHSGSKYKINWNSFDVLEELNADTIVIWVEKFRELSNMIALTDSTGVACVMSAINTPF